MASNGKVQKAEMLPILVGILVLLFVVVFVWGGGGSERLRDVPLSARVSYGAGVFSITNFDSYAWDNCDLQLNDDYRVSGVRLAPGRSMAVSPADFVTTSGARFNIFTTKPLDLFIYCRGTPHGTRSTLVGWR